LRSGSSNFVEVKLRKLNKDRVTEQIRKGVRSLRGVLCAILFGSLVENRYTGSSDADLLIIIENDLPQNERYRRYNRILADVEVQPLILTLDEVASRIKNGDTFIINIVATGIPLVGEELFKYLRKLCREAIERYGLKKMSFGWIQTKDIRNT